MGGQRLLRFGKLCVRTSFLSAGEAVAYYAARRVANFPDLLADSAGIGEFTMFCISLKASPVVPTNGYEGGRELILRCANMARVRLVSC